MYYSFCTATASCFENASDCNQICAAKGGTCATQFTQCPEFQSPCTQCHTQGKVWCADLNLCLNSASDCAKSCKQCSGPSDTCPQ
jgi:hypothetical protein